MKENQKMTSKLSIDEYARLFSGASAMSTLSLRSKGFGGLVMSDGPIGVRKEDANGNSLAGISRTLPSTCFPALSTICSSFDLPLIGEVASCIGKEAKHYGIDILLGPAINIMRNPLCGRNFEYCSEDPFLSGAMGVSYVEALQKEGVGATLKHFAANNNETNRFVGDSLIEPRSLHDIYLKPFEMVTKAAHPYCVMTAYNKLNGEFCSQNSFLLDHLLRKEWGFDGVIMTDWGGTVDRVRGFKAGCELEMPGCCLHNILASKEALTNGTISEGEAIESFKRMKEIANKTSSSKGIAVSFDEHYKVALKAGEEGAVLLKNDGALPLRESDDICLIGDLYDVNRYQGSGSSMLNPARFLSIEQGFAMKGLHYELAKGYDSYSSKPDKKEEDKALRLAASHNIIVFFGGLTDFMESEGFDRDDMKLPANQVSLLEKLIALGKKVVFVYFGGSPVELPFLMGLNALIDMGLPGEGIGEATTNLLFGNVSPSGKLTYSWPKKYEDVPYSDDFIKNENELYKESIYVGYRYYLSFPEKVLFPFGYGLSYSKFSYHDFEVLQGPGGVTVKVTLTNIGDFLASEIVEVYSSAAIKGLSQPIRELKGFARIRLSPQETAAVSIDLPYERFNVYDPYKKKEIFAKGAYTIGICHNSLNPIQEKTISMGQDEVVVDPASNYSDGNLALAKNGKLSDSDFLGMVELVKDIEQTRKHDKPCTMETPIRAFSTPFGRFFKWVTAYVGLRQYKKGLKIKDKARKERETKAGWFVYRLMGNNCLRSLSFSSGGAFPYKLALGVLHMVNGHPLKGLITMIKKEK